MHLGMAIDLNLCVGCNTCVIACKAGNGTPPGIFWTKVLEKEEGVFPFASRSFWPMRCMQCTKPLCVEVCPTGATTQRKDGIVTVDGKKCVGCKACLLACPYGARAVWDKQGAYYGSEPTPYEARLYARHTPGAVQKCDFCASRLENGSKPFCVQNCLTSCIIFGDLDDPNSEVNVALKEAHVKFRLKEELGTEPSIYFLG